LAAAAAIALVAWIARTPDPTPDEGKLPIVVVNRTPDGTGDPGELSVTISRPGLPAAAVVSPIEVATIQSPFMDEEIQRLDEERRQHATEFVSDLEREPEPLPLAPEEFIEEPPL
jgi:hypothetical protein